MAAKASNKCYLNLRGAIIKIDMPVEKRTVRVKF